MNLTEILDFALPLTPEIRKCSYKRQHWEARRQKLQRMIEAYRRGDVVQWEAMRLSIDIEEVLKSKLN